MFYNLNAINICMFIKTKTERTEHQRLSKNRVKHSYFRVKTIVHFRCDSCGAEFTRDKGSVDPKRLSNNYFHVCADCDSKKFAQQKQVERRKIWGMYASSNLPVGKN